MNDKETSSRLSEAEASQLLRSLLHKEGNWIDWGYACQQLQHSGYSAQQIFEETGFQASQQNLVIVAAQVYASIGATVPESVAAYFQGPRSDVLYEFRILNQQQRAAAAMLAQEKQLNVDEAHEVAKAYQEFSRRSQLPAGFSLHPGDAIAYQCWKRARQKKDLQERSRLIAKGLKFAHSPSAREAIEKLLSDFTVVPSRTAPLLPVYRLEQEEELPRIVPVAGSLPLTQAEFESVFPLEAQEPFRVVDAAGGIVVPLPGWPAIVRATAPVAVFCKSDRLPKALSGELETVLVVIDRDLQEWNPNSYFAVAPNEQLTLQWFEEAPNVPLLGQVILVLRPKKILDENNIVEPWQMDD
ncbi:MAG: RuBisCO accumulation factor 1 [Cyanophyceae cyanobacterium]